MIYAILAVFALYIVVSLLTIGRVIRQAEEERASLLDRIQHPEVRQVEPGEPIVHDPPQDSAELAYVGMEVPEFVQVGDAGS